MNKIRIDLSFEQATVNEVVAKELEGLNKNTATDDMAHRIILCPGLSVTTEISGNYDLSVIFASNTKYDVKLDGGYDRFNFAQPIITFVNKISEKTIQLELADYFSMYGATACYYHCF